ncbi:MAG: hypothetical protein H0W76_13255 [Pyrinomonadaceae bacterium]|nr:hypothetical protein [Pyrinomonadaceae bacterium]
MTPGHVRQMVRDGMLQAERFGRAHAISAEALKAAAERKTKPGPIQRQQPRRRQVRRVARNEHNQTTDARQDGLQASSAEANACTATG